MRERNWRTRKRWNWRETYWSLSSSHISPNIAHRCSLFRLMGQRNIAHQRSLFRQTCPYSHRHRRTGMSWRHTVCCHTGRTLGDKPRAPSRLGCRCTFVDWLCRSSCLAGSHSGVRVSPRWTELPRSARGNRSGSNRRPCDDTGDGLKEKHHHRR